MNITPRGLAAMACALVAASPPTARALSATVETGVGIFSWLARVRAPAAGGWPIQRAEVRL